MRGITGVLFDLDGTLIDSERSICDAASQAFAELGVGVSVEQIAEHLGAPLEELYDTFVCDRRRDGYERFSERYRDLHDAHPDKLPPPFPGTLEALAQLRSRLELPMAVATTKPSDRARVQVEAAGLTPYFAHVQGTDVGMRPKPAPDVLMHACRVLRVDTRAVVMVGDTHRDVLAARRVGAYAVAIAHDRSQRTRLLGFGADLVVHSIEEVVEWLCVDQTPAAPVLVE